jgi:hypothetical protein
MQNEPNHRAGAKVTIPAVLVDVFRKDLYGELSTIGDTLEVAGRKYVYDDELREGERLADQLALIRHAIDKLEHVKGALDAIGWELVQNLLDVEISADAAFLRAWADERRQFAEGVLSEVDNPDSRAMWADPNRVEVEARHLLRLADLFDPRVPEAC